MTFTLPVNGGGSEVLGTATATASGSAGPVTGTVPSNEPFGPRTITATGGSSGRAGAAAVTISNSSPQLGYGPQRLGFEENDGAISKHQAVGASYFSQAWAVKRGRRSPPRQRSSTVSRTSATLAASSTPSRCRTPRAVGRPP